jgi:hypothetical protein
MHEFKTYVLQACFEIKHLRNTFTMNCFKTFRAHFMQERIVRFALKGAPNKRSMTRVRNKRPNVKKHALGLGCCDFPLVNGDNGPTGGN